MGKKFVQMLIEARKARKAQAIAKVNARSAAKADVEDVDRIIQKYALSSDPIKLSSKYQSALQTRLTKWLLLENEVVLTAKVVAAVLRKDSKSLPIQPYCL